MLCFLLFSSVLVKSAAFNIQFLWCYINRALLLFASFSSSPSSSKYGANEECYKSVEEGINVSVRQMFRHRSHAYLFCLSFAFGSERSHRINM